MESEEISDELLARIIEILQNLEFYEKLEKVMEEEIG
jgi:hypothetical protein